ncbi:hypothetical protein LINPERPRIM_LOCUS31729 [Linum perenne]
MDYRNDSSDNLRNKCAACYRQFNKKEHLVEHMRISFHSVHEPKCGICKKHCRSFESLREHLIGPLPKQECKNIFNIRGCRFCLTILDTSNARRLHQDRCQFHNVNAGLVARMASLGLRDSLSSDSGYSRGTQVVALACKMVGGGSDGSLDVCGRVCLIDQNENILFHSYVKPPIPVTNYRDTAKYPPLMKTSKLSNSLKYLTQAYLGYDIQIGTQDPYEDCVATMRLYMRMRCQQHGAEDYPVASDPQNRNNLAPWRQNELERMSPEDLLALSRSDYYCWCLDS